MPEPATAQTGTTAPRPTTAATLPRAELLDVLASAVLAVPGVARLEPTLSTSGPAVLLRRRPTDGLHLLVQGTTADVDATIATTADAQARAVTHEVQARVTDVLAAHGYTPGAVTVTVLTIDPDQRPVRSVTRR